MERKGISIFSSIIYSQGLIYSYILLWIGLRVIIELDAVFGMYIVLES